MSKNSILLYFWSIFLLLVVGFLFGFALPFLISAPNTELVLLGLFTIVCLPVIIGFIIIKKIIPIFKNLKEKN